MSCQSTCELACYKVLMPSKSMIKPNTAQNSFSNRDRTNNTLVPNTHATVLFTQRSMKISAEPYIVCQAIHPSDFCIAAPPETQVRLLDSLFSAASLDSSMRFQAGYLFLNSPGGHSFHTICLLVSVASRLDPDLPPLPSPSPISWHALRNGSTSFPVGFRPRPVG